MGRSIWSQLRTWCGNSQWMIVLAVGSLLLVGCRQPPEVSTDGAGDVTATSAMLNGTVRTYKVSTITYRYATMADLSDGTSVQLSDTMPPSETRERTKYEVSGLNPDTTYYYRVIAKNEYGESSGKIVSFKTAGSPPRATAAATPSTTAPTAVTGGTTAPVAVAGTAAGAVAPASGAPTSGSTATTTPPAAPVTAVTPATSAPSATSVAPAATPVPAPQGPPTVGLLAPTFIHANDMTLRGTIKPNQLPATARFEYSTSPTLSSDVRTVDVEAALNDAGAVVTVSCFIAQLREGTTYYFRLVGANGAGTSKTDIISMTTLSSGGSYRP